MATLKITLNIILTKSTFYTACEMALFYNHAFIFIVQTLKTTSNKIVTIFDLLDFKYFSHHFQLHKFQPLLVLMLTMITKKNNPMNLAAYNFLHIHINEIEYS